MDQAVTAPGIEYQFFNYPPVYLLLCAVLAQLPFLASFVLFIAATFAFYLAVARRILGARSPAAIVVLLSFPMVFWTMGLGQNAFLTAALFGLATVLLESRPIAAGLLFGLLCYKPHFGVLVPIALAAGGYWRSFLAAGCSAAALVLISLALFGWETWQAFLVTAGAAHSVYESGRILFAGFATPFGAVRLLGGPVALAYAVQGLASLAAAALVLIVWRYRLSLPLRAAGLAAASLVAAPVAIFYDLMLGTIAVCWLMRDESPALTPAEKTFFAAITVLLLDVRHLGESWHLPVAAGADARERRVELRHADEERIVLRREILAIGEIERDAVRGADRREMAPFRTSLQIETVGKKFGGGPSVPRRVDRVIEFDAHLCPPVW